MGMHVALSSIPLSFESLTASVRVIITTVLAGKIGVRGDELGSPLTGGTTASPAVIASEVVDAASALGSRSRELTGVYAVGRDTVVLTLDDVIRVAASCLLPTVSMDDVISVWLVDFVLPLVTRLVVLLADDVTPSNVLLYDDVILGDDIILFCDDVMLSEVVFPADDDTVTRVVATAAVVESASEVAAVSTRQEPKNCRKRHPGHRKNAHCTQKSVGRSIIFYARF